MEIKKKKCETPDETGKTKGKFPRFKGMLESLKRKAMVLAVVSVSALALHCGPDPKDPDGGTHDADTTTDSGTDSDTTTDSGTDGGTSLCDMYPDGHANRNVFYLGFSVPVEDGDEVVMFRQLSELSGGMRATFAIFNSAAPTDADFISMYEGEQETMNVPGIGETTFELCSTTSLACKWQITGNEGDSDCTATMASTRAWDTD